MLLAVLVLAPCAEAAAGGGVDLVIASPEDVRLDGRLAVELPGGRARLVDFAAAGEAAIEAADGVLEIWTWRTVTVRLEEQMGVLGTSHSRRASEPERERIPLAHANLSLALDRELLESTVLADAGTLRAVGRVADAARPTWLLRGRSTATSSLPADAPTAQPDPVRLSLPAGWAYVGNETVDDPPEGRPRLADAHLVAEGHVRVSLRGGNLTIRDGGEERRVRLGNWTEDGAASPGGPATARVQVVRVAIFEGSVAHASWPARGAYVAGAPAATWRLDGSATWRAADVEGRAGEAEAASRGALLTLRGAGTLTPEPRPALLGAAPDVYRARGDFLVVVDGRLVAAQQDAAALPAPVAAGGLLAALALAAALVLAGPGKVAAAFYTRLHPGDLLDHPARRRLHDIVRAEPGIHQRELARRVGTAWGPFRFHLHALERAGYLRLENRGKYVSVLLAAAASGPVVAIPHPAARAVYAALPEDGSEALAPVLAARLGMSRQLVAHHLRGLAASGVVRLARTPRGLAASRPQPLAEALEAQAAPSA